MTVHVFHEILVNEKGTVIYIATANTVQAFDVDNAKLIAKYESLNTIKSQDQQDPKSEIVEAKVPSKPATEVRNHLSLLKLVENGKYLICSHSEEKSVLVLLAHDLTLVNKKIFPKRPSAVDILCNESGNTLVVGDKFGDVYTVDVESTENLSSDLEPVLGHVSMLTDVAAVELAGRSYLISADRDEHIRVTRYPQTFVIERWLFGHQQFISSMVVVPWNKQLLVSGGGDDFLCVWDWSTGQLLSRFQLREIVQEHLNQSHINSKGNDDSKEITISKLLCWQSADNSCSHIVFALIEGTGVLLCLELGKEDDCYQLKLLNKLVHDKDVVSFTVDLNGNVYLTTDDCDGYQMLACYKIDNKGNFTLKDIKSVKEIQKIGVIDRVQSGVNPVVLNNVKQLRKRGDH